MFYALRPVPGPAGPGLRAALHDAAALAWIVADEFHSSYEGSARADYLRVLGSYVTDLGGRPDDGPSGLLAAFEGRRITIRFGPVSGHRQDVGVAEAERGEHQKRVTEHRDLNRRLRAAIIVRAERQSRKEHGGPLTEDELRRVLTKYPGDLWGAPMTSRRTGPSGRQPFLGSLDWDSVGC